MGVCKHNVVYYLTKIITTVAPKHMEQHTLLLPKNTAQNASLLRGNNLKLEQERQSYPIAHAHVFRDTNHSSKTDVPFYALLKPSILMILVVLYILSLY